MEKVLDLQWKIYRSEVIGVERYCHNCGEKMLFKDSLKRRQNANGKNIFHFAIYKCINGHTWNKKIEVIKTKAGLTNEMVEYSQRDSIYDMIDISDSYYGMYNRIDVCLKVMEDKERLDKFIADKLVHISRNKVVDFINLGHIRVNREIVRSNYKLRVDDVINIHTEKLDLI